MSTSPSGVVTVLPPGALNYRKAYGLTTVSRRYVRYNWTERNAYLRITQKGLRRNPEENHHGLQLNIYHGIEKSMEL